MSFLFQTRTCHETQSQENQGTKIKGTKRTKIIIINAIIEKNTNQEESDYYNNKQSKTYSANNFAEDVIYNKVFIAKTSDKYNDSKTCISDSGVISHMVNSEENLMKLKYAKTLVTVGDRRNITLTTCGN